MKFYTVNLSNDLPSLSPSWRSTWQKENHISEKKINLKVSGSVTQCKYVMQFVSQLFNFVHAMAKIYEKYCDKQVSLLIINTAVTCLPSNLLIERHPIDWIINSDVFEFPRHTNLYTIKTIKDVCSPPITIRHLARVYQRPHCSCDM